MPLWGSATDERDAIPPVVTLTPAQQADLDADRLARLEADMARLKRWAAALAAELAAVKQGQRRVVIQNRGAPWPAEKRR